MKKLLLLFMLLPYSFSFADISLTPPVKNYPNLSAGISKIEIQGAPGRLSILSPEAFSILTDTKNRVLAAGAFYGKGKAAVFTHTDFLKPSKWKKNETEKLFHQTLAWLSAQSEQKKFFILNNKELSQYLKLKGYKTEEKSLLPAHFNEFSLLLLSSDINKPFSSEQIKSIQEFIHKGGAVLSTPMGWVWRNYSSEGKKGRPFSEYFENILYKPMGIQFLDWSADSKIQISAMGANAHPVVTLNQIINLINQKKNITESEINRYLTWSFEYLAELSYPNLLISEKQMDEIVKTYQSTFKMIQPTEKNSIKPNQSREILLLALMNAITQGINPDKQIIFSHVSSFPGAIDKKAELLKDFQLNLGIPKKNSRWQSTGLYAPAGSKITLEFPNSNWAERKLSVRIGAHKDWLIPFSQNIKEWKRFPNLVMRKELSSIKNEIASPHGGLIYIEIPDNLHIQEALSIQISGAVKSPFFKLGETSKENWEQIRNLKAPWGEIEGQNIILTLPSNVISKIDDPEKLIQWWDGVIKYYGELAGIEQHEYKERLVPDIQIKAGYLHSGYPIMSHMDVAEFTAGLKKSIVEKEELFINGSWGHFHELGHNYQKAIYTFEGSGEVTVNFFTLYALQKHLNIGLHDHPWFKNKKIKLKKYFDAGKKFEDWKKDPQVALLTFMGIIEKFGWEPMKKTIARFTLIEKEKKSLSDMEKRNYWVLFLSEETSCNLAPYFKAWGIPFENSIAKQVGNLKPWNDFKLQ